MSSQLNRGKCCYCQCDVPDTAQVCGNGYCLAMNTLSLPIFSSQETESQPSTQESQSLPQEPTNIMSETRLETPGCCFNCNFPIPLEMHYCGNGRCDGWGWNSQPLHISQSP